MPACSGPLSEKGVHHVQESPAHRRHCGFRTGRGRRLFQRRRRRTWLNSTPLTQQQLRGKVVLVDFWTFDCINCIRTLPYVKSWHEKYKDQGLVVVGVHTPEYPFERKTENVAAAIKRFGITYPVAQDNQYGTWRAYNNQYWPAAYLIDKQGRIVYTHFGEGNYDVTEAKIRELLAQN
jgi:thiol-disulfide isomerase/thioredoxin